MIIVQQVSWAKRCWPSQSACCIITYTVHPGPLNSDEYSFFSEVGRPVDGVLLVTFVQVHVYIYTYIRICAIGDAKLEFLR